MINELKSIKAQVELLAAAVDQLIDKENSRIEHESDKKEFAYVNLDLISCRNSLAKICLEQQSSRAANDLRDRIVRYERMQDELRKKFATRST